MTNESIKIFNDIIKSYSKITFSHKSDFDTMISTLRGGNPGSLGSGGYIKLETDAERSLRGKLESTEAELLKTMGDLEQASKTREDLESEKERVVLAFEAHRKVSEMAFIMGRVCPEAGVRLMEDHTFVDMFKENSAMNCFVLSVDIRRSTELMLKARDSGRFAAFMVRLCEGLRDAVLDNGGVFDKFTGDGILAFFPDDFTGPDAAGRALNAARVCHDVFFEVYLMHESAFSVIMADAGLGIGIDYGSVTVVRFGKNELSIVGTPVVYACRLGSVRVRSTAVNQAAKERIGLPFLARCNLVRERIDLKHEGAIYADLVSMDAPFEETMFAPFPWTKPKVLDHGDQTEK